MTSLTISLLIRALNLCFAQKLLTKEKYCSRLLEAQKVAPKARSCRKVAEHNLDRPIHEQTFPRLQNPD